MDHIRSFFSYFPLTARLLIYGIKSSWEYKTSFLVQVGGMALNDVLLIFIWVFFFRRFPEINGWTFKDTQLLFSVHVFSFVFGMFIFGGVLNLTRQVAEGTLDQYIVQPRSILWRTLTNGFRLDILGDFVFGIGILIYVCVHQGWENLLLAPVAGLLGGIGMVMISVAFQSIGFWVKRFERAGWHYFWAVESPGFYPQNTLTGSLRVVLLTAIPSVWIITFPYNFVHDHSWYFLAIVVLFDIAITVCAATIFRRGLRHYESGSLVRVNN